VARGFERAADAQPREAEAFRARLKIRVSRPSGASAQLRRVRGRSRYRELDASWMGAQLSRAEVRARLKIVTFHRGADAQLREAESVRTQRQASRGAWLWRSSGRAAEQAEAFRARRRFHRHSSRSRRAAQRSGVSPRSASSKPWRVALKEQRTRSRAGGSIPRSAQDQRI
jgi:hypothetical protein